MLAGITAQPSAFEGDSFLLVSVAVVVLGGTSLLGGRGYPLATVVAAVFLEQLVQFVVALGVSTAVADHRPGRRARDRRLPLHRQLEGTAAASRAVRAVARPGLTAAHRSLAAGPHGATGLSCAQEGTSR